MLRVKALYNGEHRRFSLPADVSFAVLQSRLFNAFAVGTAMVIKYRDSDNDLVTISCDEELREAIVPDELLRLELSNDVNNLPALSIPQAVGTHTDATEILAGVLVGWLVIKAIPVWAVLLGGFAIHRHIKRNPLVKQRIMNFFHSRRIGMSNQM